MIIKNLVTKSLYYYYDTFGEKTQCLFRREEFHDDLLKTILYSYGHDFFQKLYSYLDDIIQENKLTVDLFKIFYDILVKKISEELPFVIRIILREIYLKVEEIYETKTLEPLFVFLFFNFLFNPRVQENNGFKISNLDNLKDINLVINSICFNKKFKEEDKLSIFNCFINDMNNKIVEVFVNLIESLDNNETEINILMNQELCNKTVIRQSLLFYWDCDLCLRILNKIMRRDLDYSLNISRSSTTETFKSESFFVKLS